MWALIFSVAIVSNNQRYLCRVFCVLFEKCKYAFLFVDENWNFHLRKGNCGIWNCFHFHRPIAVQGIPIVVYSILRANVLYTIHAVRVLRARRPELVGLVARRIILIYVLVNENCIIHDKIQSYVETFNTMNYSYLKRSITECSYQSRY